MLPQQYCLRWKYHHSNLQTMFSQLLDRGCFCDVTLACEGQLIRAHRVVLCACSTFFDTVLTNYASERDPIIIMKDVTFADVKCLIEFMYKGEINVEHAHLASLLKTADDLKIKGLAEVSWREDEDGPPPPMPATEFHSPKRAQELYAQEQHQQHQQQQHHQRQRTISPLVVERERKSASPGVAAAAKAGHSTRLPALTPIPASQSISIAATPVPVDYYLGPKRKRGRPPLDDAYDVFNVRKMAHYASVHQQEHQAYLDARHYSVDEHRQQQHAAAAVSPPSSAAAVAAYQHHIHQQQSKQRMRQRQRREMETEEVPELLDDAHADPEWITSNLEVNVAECEQGVDNGHLEVELDIKEHKVDIDEQPVISHKKLDKKKREKTPEQKEAAAAAQANGRVARKNSNEQREREQRAEADEPKAMEMKRQRAEDEEDGVQEEEEEAATVPKPVEEIESVQQVLEQHQLPVPATTVTSSAASGSSQKSAAAPPPLHHPHYGGKYTAEGYLLNEHGMLMTHDFVHAPTVSIPVAPTSSSTSSAAAATGGAANSTTTANGSEHEFSDIKMEDYDAADLRLTSEEMSQWQDVIKMDDYLAKGRRPQFWEEPFTRRVLDAIKNKRLEMKKAARILGVSYGTLYGRYREVYGCLKHPYSSTNFRPSQSSQLAVQPRFDMVWPSPKRDSSAAAALSGQLDIGKIRPKDLSELWTRPQI